MEKNHDQEKNRCERVEHRRLIKPNYRADVKTVRKILNDQTASPNALITAKSPDGDLLKYAFAHMPDSILYLNAEGKILAYHQGHGGDGIAENHIAGRSLNDIFSKTVSDNLSTAIQQALTNHSPVGITYALPSRKTESGHQLWFYDAHVIPCDGAEMLLFIRPITNQSTLIQEQISIERDQINLQLEVNVEEIAAMNVKLAEARDLARASDRAKSEFLAVISHEIRTPLNSVISMTEMLLKTPLSAEQREYADLAHDAGITLLNQINSILDFTKLESGKIMLNMVPFSPADIVENVAEIMTIKAREKKLSLMTFIHPDIPYFVRGDPDRMRQILLNLIDNAIKFTEKGEIIVRVEPIVDASSNSAHTGHFQFSVSDTGIGLPEDAHQWLFLPFSQADSSITRKHGGTGVGLAIARNLTEIMGGKMGVHSSQDVGSTFWFTLPLRRK